MVNSLRGLANDETLLVQSGKPVGIFRTHEYAPRVLLCNSNLVGHWNSWDKFHEFDRAGLMMYGQMTAGSWIYIGTQGILQGTYETFAAAARQDRKSTRLNSSHSQISYAVFCLKKKITLAWNGTRSYVL